MTEFEMQNIISLHFDSRRNFCLPNASWGLGFRYEIDLLIISQAGYCTEVEIKCNRSDLKRDILKSHNHDNERIKYLYFAIPESLEDLIGWIPDHAGVIVVRPKREEGNQYRCQNVEVVRPAECRRRVKPLTDDEWKKLGWLISMRYWDYRRKIVSGG